jgi:hypothetical protein
MLQTEFAAVSEESQKIAGVLSSCDEKNLFDPGVDEGLNRIVNHGPVIDG